MVTILLIEDSLELAESIGANLRQENYQVIHARDGLDGLDQIKTRNPDLIILDWMLPGLDGLEVLRRLRQSSAIPVLMLTARAEEIDRVIGLEVGADDYLTKPFGMRELLARVHALLRRAEMLKTVILADQNQTDRKTISSGALVLEPDMYHALLEGNLLDLARTEFDLLYLLMRNPGRVFSRAYLVEIIWSENFIPGDRSIDNLVLRLRKKLGSAGEQIEAVWGADYRFIPHIE